MRGSARKQAASEGQGQRILKSNKEHMSPDVYFQSSLPRPEYPRISRGDRGLLTGRRPIAELWPEVSMNWAHEGQSREPSQSTWRARFLLNERLRQRVQKGFRRMEA